jgi:uncharacterized membrane protein
MEAAQVKQAVSVKLADALFGDDAFTVGSFVMPTIMTFITMVLVLTWSRYRKVIKRQANSIEKKAREVEEQWLGKRRRLFNWDGRLTAVKPWQPQIQNPPWPASAPT